MAIVIKNPIEFECPYIGRDIADKCSYPECKKVATILLRDGRSNYFIPLCSTHKNRYEMFDDPKIPARMNRLRREMKKKDANCTKNEEVGNGK